MRSKLLLQCCDFATKVDNGGHLDVGHRLVMYLPRTARIAKRVETLVQIAIRGANTRDHQRLRIAAKRVLQKSCEFGLAIRHMACDWIFAPAERAVFAEGRDHLADGGVCRNELVRGNVRLRMPAEPGAAVRASYAQKAAQINGWHAPTLPSASRP